MEGTETLLMDALTQMREEICDHHGGVFPRLQSLPPEERGRARAVRELLSAVSPYAFVRDEPDIEYFISEAGALTELLRTSNGHVLTRAAGEAAWQPSTAEHPDTHGNPIDAYAARLDSLYSLLSAAAHKLQELVDIFSDDEPAPADEPAEAAAGEN